MTDSIAVFPPGYQITDSSGAIVSGGTVYFYDAGTSSPRTVYKDSSLSTVLGTSCATDSAGYLTQSGVKVTVYTGATAYKLVCLDASAVQLWSYDNLKGAVDTSAFVTSTSATVTYTVTPITSSGTWVVADVTGKVFELNASGGNFARTLPAASTSTGVPFDCVYTGTSGIATLLAQGADKIQIDGIDSARKALLLQSKADSVRLISNGVDYRAFFLRTEPRVLNFAIEDQRTAPPGSPVTGGYYLMSGAPSGAFATAGAAANDIVMFDGQANYQIYRPSTDCAWTAFDKSTNAELLYRDSAWSTLTTRISDAIGYTPGRDFILVTEQAATSGTALDFTSIPSWVKRITIMFDGVSTTGTSVPQIQIGDSGGVETASYNSGSGRPTAILVGSTGFPVVYDHAANAVLHGKVEIALQDAANNVWVISGTIFAATINLMHYCAGSKALSGTLDRVRITTVGGADTFDAGAISISYEG